MKDKYPKTSCLSCGENHSYTIKERKSNFLYDKYNIEYLERYAVCDNCGKEVWNGDIDDENTKRENLAIRAKLEKIVKEQEKQINNLMKGKYIPATIAKRIEKLKNEFEKEFLKDIYDKIKERLKMHCEYTDEEHIGWYLPENKIDLLIDEMAKGGV